MPKRLPDDDIAFIVATYTTPAVAGTWVGTTTIARQLGVTATCVARHLRDAGVMLRTAKEAHAHGKRCKPVTNVPVGDPPACKCGCGAAVEWNKERRKWKAYARGHYRDPPGWTRPERVRRRAGFIGPREEPRYRGSPGPRNGSWRGGVTPERQRIYKSAEWRELVAAVWRRDRFCCRRCGTGKVRGRVLHAHHVVPWAEAPSLRRDFDNLLTLCGECHVWVHSLANAGGEYLGCAWPPCSPAAGGGGVPSSARAT